MRGEASTIVPGSLRVGLEVAKREGELGVCGSDCLSPGLDCSGVGSRERVSGGKSCSSIVEIVD